MRDFLAVRRDRRSALPERFANFEAESELNEGLAQYALLRALSERVVQQSDGRGYVVVLGEGAETSSADGAWASGAEWPIGAVAELHIESPELSLRLPRARRNSFTPSGNPSAGTHPAPYPGGATRHSQEISAVNREAGRCISEYPSR